MTEYPIIAPEEVVTLGDPGVEAVRIHGSALVPPYLYGVGRGVLGNLDRQGGLVRLSLTDYDERLFDPLPTPVASGVPYGQSHLFNGDAMCAHNGFLYVGLDDNSDPDAGVTTRIYRVDPATLARTVLYEHQLGLAQVILAHGGFLYVTAFQWMLKIDLATGDLVTSNSLTFDPAMSGLNPQPIHAGVIEPDGSHLWLAASNAANGGSTSRLVKVQTSDLAVVAHAQIPASTDDMTQDGGWCFIGVEEATPGAFGYSAGACAVRKADMAVFLLGKLGASDTAATRSYASTIFSDGTRHYLVETKTNRHIYVLDVSDPASWTLGTDVSSVLLIDATIQLPAEVAGTPNEIHVDAAGKVHVFVWNSSSSSSYVSSVARFTIPGVMLRATTLYPYRVVAKRGGQVAPSAAVTVEV